MDTVVGGDGDDPHGGGVALGEDHTVAHLIVALALDDPLDALLVNDDNEVRDVRVPAPLW